MLCRMGTFSLLVPIIALLFALKVHAVDPHPHVRPMGKVKVMAGDTFVITCPIDESVGYPVDSRTWEKDNRLLPYNRRQAVYPDGKLVIDNVQRAMDQGTYTCVARTAQGYTSRGNLQLEVFVPPRIMPFDYPHALDEGEAAQAQCIVIEGDMPLEIIWTFSNVGGSDNAFGNLAGLQTMKIGRRSSILLIDSVTAEHAGNYTCTVSNAHAVSNHTAELKVNVPPRRWIVEPLDRTFAEGREVRLECKTDGLPKPIVTWKKAAGDNSTEYRDLKSYGLGMRVEEDGQLVIPAIPKDAHGYYMCEVTNGIGAGLSAVMHITVAEEPPKVPFGSSEVMGMDPSTVFITGLIQMLVNLGRFVTSF